MSIVIQFLGSHAMMGLSQACTRSDSWLSQFTPKLALALTAS